MVRERWGCGVDQVSQLPSFLSFFPFHSFLLRSRDISGPSLSLSPFTHSLLWAMCGKFNARRVSIFLTRHQHGSLDRQTVASGNHKLPRDFTFFLFFSSRLVISIGEILKCCHSYLAHCRNTLLARMHGIVCTKLSLLHEYDTDRYS